MKQRNLNLFYLHELLFQFADTMLILVLPIFIYKLFNSISAVFLFDFAWNLLFGLLIIPVFSLGMKLGKPKYFMALGMVFYVLSLWFLGKTTPESISYIIPGTLFFVLYVSFYWLTKHWFFSTNSDYTKMGKQVGKIGLIKILVSFIAPIFGGLMSYFVSFNATFLIGSALGLISIIPIMLFNAPAIKDSFKPKDIKVIMQKTELKEIRPAHFWEAVSAKMVRDCWILAFAIFIGSILDLGILVGVSTLITAILIKLAGHWFDQRSRKRILTRLTNLRASAAMLFSLVYFFPQAGFIWAVQTANSFVNSMHDTVAFSYVYAYSNKIHPAHFHINRELTLVAGRFVSTSILIISFQFVSAKFLFLAIAIGAISVEGWQYLKRADHLLH